MFRPMDKLSLVINQLTGITSIRWKAFLRLLKHSSTCVPFRHISTIVYESCPTLEERLFTLLLRCVLQLVQCDQVS